MIKSIIIFGGSGLIGQEIIRYLQEFNLNILNADLKKSNNKNVNFLKCDVTKKKKLLKLKTILLKNLGI